MQIYLNGKTWKPGDTVRFQAGPTTSVAAGLFFYHGFGSGDYYSIDGNVYFGTSSQAAEKAHEEGVAFRNLDSFAGYRPVYLGD